MQLWRLWWAMARNIQYSSGHLRSRNKFIPNRRSAGLSRWSQQAWGCFMRAERVSLLLLGKRKAGGRKMAASCRGVKAVNGKEELERNPWSVLTQEQVGINWVINKTLARQEHWKGPTVSLNPDRQKNKSQQRWNGAQFLERAERALDVTDEWIQYSRRGPSQACNSSFCSFKIIPPDSQSVASLLC